MSNKKETAVEWLFSQLPEHLRLSRDGFDILQQAKEMEKEQMKSIYNPTIMQNEDGKLYAKSFEQYYKETYTDKP
jgi:hypothetical protein